MKRSAPALCLLRSPSRMVTMVCSGGERRGGRQEYPEVRSGRMSRVNARGISIGVFPAGGGITPELRFRKPYDCPFHHREPQDVRLHSGPFDSIPCSYLQNISSYRPRRSPSRTSPSLNGPDVASCESIRGRSVHGGVHGGICIPN